MTTITEPPWMTVTESGTQYGIAWIVALAPRGSAKNGYVYIPEGHPWRERAYWEIDKTLDWDNELTYGKENWIGFDTMHYRDVWLEEEYADYDHENTYKVFWTNEKVARKARELALLVSWIGEK